MGRVFAHEIDLKREKFTRRKEKDGQSGTKQVIVKFLTFLPHDPKCLEMARLEH